MATLPGLPMFGHGQIEGFTEKYGMEYRRAYRDETAGRGPGRSGTSARSSRCCSRRHLFAEVEHFYLYDFFTPEGHVNEDVFAYSNRSGDERALVVYHNKYASTRGLDSRSPSATPARPGNGEERALMQKHLGTGLGLHPATIISPSFAIT